MSAPSKSPPAALEGDAATVTTALQITEAMSVDPPTLESVAAPSELLPSRLERGTAAVSTDVQETAAMSVDPPTSDTTASLTTPPQASEPTALSESPPIETTALSKELDQTLESMASLTTPPQASKRIAFSEDLPLSEQTTTSSEEQPPATALSETLPLSADATSLEELPPTTALTETLRQTPNITSLVEELPPTAVLSEGVPLITDITTSLEELSTTSDATPSFETATPTLESSVSLEYLETPEATGHVETLGRVQEIAPSLQAHPQTTTLSESQLTQEVTALSDTQLQTSDTALAESRQAEVVTPPQAQPLNEDDTASEEPLTGCSLALAMATNDELPEVLPLDQTAAGHFERRINRSDPLGARLEDELLTPAMLHNLVNPRGPELHDDIVEDELKQNPGPSAAVGDIIPEQNNIFSEPTEYEEEFLLTENMVNSYTFSDESKSTDYSNTDSPMDSNAKHVANDENADTIADKPTSESVGATVAAEVKSSTDAEKDVDDKLLGDEANAEKDAETDIDTDLMTDADEDELLNASDEIMKESDVDKASETAKLTKSTDAEDLHSKVTTEQAEKMDVDEPNNTEEESLKQAEKTEDSDKQLVPEDRPGEKDKMDTNVITPIAGKLDKDNTKDSAMNSEPSEKIDEKENKNTEKDGDNSSNVPGPSELDKEKLDGDSSDGMPALEDSLGLLSEARTLLREEDDDDEEEEDDDDDNNDDDESNLMAPDSSEVESNAAVNDDLPDSDQLEDDAEPTGQSGLAIGQSEEESMEHTEQSLENVDQSTENIDQSTENVDQSTENVDQSTENVDQSTENVDQSMGNIDETLESIARAVMDYEEEDEFEFTIAAVAGGDDDEGQKKDAATADDTQELKNDVKKSPKRAKDSKTDAPPKDAVKPTTAPKPMDVDLPMETSKLVTEAEKIPAVADDNDLKKNDERSAKVDEVPEKAQEKAPMSPAVPAKSPAPEEKAEKAPDTPSKAKKLEIAKPGNVMSIVELEESSSDSDVQETEKSTEPTSPAKSSPQQPDHSKEASEEATTTVNIPKEIDIMSTSRGDTSSIITTQEDNVISGIPAPTPPKKSAPRINTSEITIKTTPRTPEPTTITISDETEDVKKKAKPKLGLEVFNVDSDEEDARTAKPEAPKKLSAIELQNARDTKKCINYICESDSGAEYYPAPSFVLSYYEVKRSRRCSPLVCSLCLQRVCQRTAGLMDGVRNMKPLLSLDMDKECQEFVEISDSDSDSDGDEAPTDAGEKLSAANVKLMEESLAEVLNETWRKYGLGGQLRDCEDELKEQLHNLEKASEEIDGMLADSQKTMDQLRNELYGTFASEVRELEPIEIDDGASRPGSPLLHALLSAPSESPEVSDTESRRSKRQRKVVNYGEERVRSPIPLGYEHLNTGTAAAAPSAPKMPTAPGESDPGAAADPSVAPKLADDSADVSLVKLSAEVAPAGLPAPGELQRPTLRFGDSVYAVRQSAAGSWAVARVLEIWPPGSPAFSNSPFTVARIRFEHKLKGSPVRQLSGKELAYTEPPPVRLTIGTRVIALFKDLTNALKRESYYSGIIAESPTPVNSYRYLVFFDDGYAQYVQHASMRVVYETSARVWDDVHPDSREFVRKYLVTYPERPMVRLQTGQALKTEWNGKWWVSRVVGVDASLVQVLFEADGRIEWIYRGSTRLAPLYLELQAAERHRPRGLTRLNKQAPTKANMPYVEYTRSDEQDGARTVDNAQTANIMQQEENRRMTAQQQRSVAKKSSAAPQVYPPQRPSGPQPLNDLMTRVVYYSPKAAVRPYKMVPHACSSQCRRTDVLPLKELKTYNPLTRPLLIGWERQILRFKGKKVVMYRAPCGRRVRDMRELHRYLRAVQSDCSVDLFDFNHTTHCLAEFVLNKCYVSKKDLSHGKENVPVPCVNYYDGTLPEFCLYNTERTPTSGVPLNLDPDFLCGCDCTDDCQDKSKCACWKLTLEGARTIGLDGVDVGYHYKRLPEPLSSGIYECNSRCKCAQTCLNRVAQHPLQLKLQVFKTLNRGWGIRALNDVPKGAFLCVYAGNLLTDATANLDGINEGDEYLAELDYIEVVERMKEGYESDVQEEKRRRKNKEAEGAKTDEEDEDDDEEEEEEEEEDSQRDTDADFQPEYIGPNTKFTKRLRKRVADKDKEKDKNAEREGEGAKEKTRDEDGDLITISDDEEVREPSRFTAQTGLNEDDYAPRHVSVRTFYGKDEACYIMDAKVQGNIGRYLNHSCTPNVFVQNVFVDTHDPRFPWVAFFALTHIQAGSELTWNYNYDVGSVPDKVLYCKCGATNCRGRLL